MSDLIATPAARIPGARTSRSGSSASVMRAEELPITFSAGRDCGAIESEAATGAWIAQQPDISSQTEPGCGWVLQSDGQQSVGGTHASVGWITPKRHTKSMSAATSRRFTETPSPAAPPQGTSEIRSAIRTGESSPRRAVVRSFVQLER